MWCISTTVSQWIHNALARYLHTPLTWHDPCPIHRIHTCLSTVLWVSGHNVCYLTFPLLSNGIRSTLTLPSTVIAPCICYATPGHRRTLPPYLVWVPSTSLAVKTKGSCPPPVGMSIKWGVIASTPPVISTTAYCVAH